MNYYLKQESNILYLAGTGLHFFAFRSDELTVIDSDIQE